MPAQAQAQTGRLPASEVEGPLSLAEICSFKQNGFLILRGCLDLATVDGWREDFWSHIRLTFPDFQVENASTWPKSAVIPGGFSVPFGAHPAMQAIVQQLAGNKLKGGGGGVLVNWPNTELDPADWRPSAAGHVDGYGPGGWSGGFQLAATTYLADVDHKGGGFTFWPKSHLAVHRYFCEHPHEIDGSFYAREDWDAQGWGLMYKGEGADFVGEATEFLGQRGDVVLWHNFTCHTGSTNCTPGRPRLGIFSRWHNSDMHMGPPNNVEPPDFEPLDSRLRKVRAPCMGTKMVFRLVQRPTRVGLCCRACARAMLTRGRGA